ncbi:MAG: ArgE/DapE family deacylase, partial [Anaerolineales bacterium]|nr:ArgE/DapE family deacylase [Anaerolineales bacterium]
IDRDFLIQTLSHLVQIYSTNPSLLPGAAGEAEIATYTQRLLQDIGLTTTAHEPQPGRISVVGRLAGQGHGRTLLYNAHYDTVGVTGMAEPFSGAIREGKLYGRGSYDMKGSLAAQIAAAKAIADAGLTLQGDLLIAAVADEEHASLGVQSIIPHYAADAVIVTEPSELEISLAHKGFIWLEVTTHGKAYHGSRPDLGIDANMRMGRFLAKLDRLEQALLQRPPHPLLGPPSLHAATLQGGTELSVYAAACQLGIERRTLPGETAAQVVNEIQPLLDELQAADETFRADLQTLLVRDAFEVSPQAPIVQTLTAVSEQVLGTAAPHIGQKFWTDAAFHAAAGSDTVLIGPKGHGLHSAEEWVDVESVVQLAEILAHTAVAYLNP